MDIWLFPSLFPSSREKGAEAERALINFFLLKLKSYIKTLFPTYFPGHPRSSFSWGRGREDNRTIRHQICPDYNWEKESYKPILTATTNKKRLEHQQISINGQNNKSSPVIFVLITQTRMKSKMNSTATLPHFLTLYNKLDPG